MSDRDGMGTWFAVTLLFASKIQGTPSLRPLCEERVILLCAKSQRGVADRVRRYAREEEHSYKNMYGETVTWRYVGIEKVEPLEDPVPDGMWEVASRHVRRGLGSLKRLT